MEMASGQQGGSEQYLQLVQQLIELQRENNELRSHREDGPNRCLTKKPDRPIVEHGYTEGDWTLFVDTWD